MFYQTLYNILTVLRSHFLYLEASSKTVQIFWNIEFSIPDYLRSNLTENL